MSSRLFAAVLVASLVASGCQGAPGASPNSGLLTPAKGMATIKGFVTSAGVIAAGGGNYSLLQAASGAPVPNADIHLQGGTFTGGATTGPDGSFSATVPGGGTYTVVATHSDGQGGLLKQVAVVEVPLAEEPPIIDVKSLVTRRTGSIQGVIALSDGADPEGADVFVPGTTLVGKVSAKGRFALANMPEGTWTVVLQKPGYQRAALTDLHVQSGRPLVLTESVTLARGEASDAGLKAVVRDAQGQAVIGAHLTAIASGGQSYTSTSDDQGNVSLSGLPAGDYQVQLYRAFYQVPARRSVTVAAGAATDLGTLTLASTVMHFGQITGRVVDEAGEAIDGAVVQLDPPVAEQQFTDANGRFTIDRVMPGEYTLRAAAGGFEVGSRDVMLDNRAGAVANLGGGLTLRQPFDPAKPKAADRKVAQIHPPVAAVRREGNDLIITWQPVGLPDGVSGIVYDLEGQVAPGLFIYMASATGHQLTLKDYGTAPASFRLIARPLIAPAAGYRLAQVGGSSIGSGISGISIGNIQSMDIETALMMVQAQRAKLLETQLKAQIQEVQNRNELVAKLQTAMSQMGNLPQLLRDMEALNARTGKDNVHPEIQLKASELKAMAPAQIEAKIAQLKGQIDAAGNSQQMDMLRLQSMSNKRNEAFDVMTNFVKKMQESRSSIIGNMR